MIVFAAHASDCFALVPPALLSNVWPQTAVDRDRGNRRMTSQTHLVKRFLPAQRNQRGSAMTRIDEHDAPSKANQAYGRSEAGRPGADLGRIARDFDLLPFAARSKGPKGSRSVMRAVFDLPGHHPDIDWIREQEAGDHAEGHHAPEEQLDRIHSTHIPSLNRQAMPGRRPTNIGKPSEAVTTAARMMPEYRVG